MKIHTEGLNCSGCNNKLLTADPYLINWFSELKKVFPTAHVSWAFRDKESQDEAYTAGLSFSTWPESKHNYMINDKPNSLALDLFEINLVGAASFRPSFYTRVYEWSLKSNFNIKWGGYFLTLRDYNHFYIESQT